MARHVTPHEPTGSPVAAAGAPGRSTLTALFISLRPEQWTKNLVVFAGLLFGLKLFDATAVVQATLAAFPDAVQVQDTAEDRDARGGGNKWRNRA